MCYRVSDETATLKFFAFLSLFQYLLFTILFFIVKYERIETCYTAPAHKANETQDFLRERCPDFITRGEWPPNSPDLNPLDYSVWSILEEKACAKPHPNVESLKRALKKAWKETSIEILAKIVDIFPKRLKACVDANGGHFE